MKRQFEQLTSGLFPVAVRHRTFEEEFEDFLQKTDMYRPQPERQIVGRERESSDDAESGTITDAELD